MDFVLIVPLVMLVFLAVLQIGLAAHVRTTLTAIAAEGARSGSYGGADVDVAQSRTWRLVRDSLVGDVVTNVAARTSRRDGVAVLEVSIDARLPVVGLLGPQTQRVTASALVEGVL